MNSETQVKMVPDNNTVENTPEPVPEKEKKSTKTRLFALVALCGTLCGIGYAGRAAYHVATDSFVAPIVLSPDSDLVIQSKLSLSALMAERMRISTKKDAIESELQSGDQAIEQLKNLQAAASKALEWTSSMSAKQANAGAHDLRALARQKTVITTMISSQENSVMQMKRDVDAGLVQKADFAREEHALNQMHVAAIENERAAIVTEMQTNQAILTNQALKNKAPGAVSTPEMLMQQDLLVRVQCDLIKLEGERRTKTAERRNLDEELSKLDELVGQLKSRPIFRATDANTNVAFVPYTQIDGVRAGAQVYECFWGAVACKPVGRVKELLPGEVILADPWGTPARGQYAIMDLTDQHAAQSRTLRVRPSGFLAPPSTSVEPSRVAAK